MVSKRKVEVFSAGCSICDEIVEKINALACNSCEVIVQDMKNDAIADRAKKLGISAVPAVVIDGELVSCCAERGISGAVLQAAGLGQPL